jgi:SsrA-binding protein
LFLYNCHISHYDKGNRYNHEEKRTRKLLLTKKEILKISQKIKKDGYTVIPLEVFFVHGLAKVEIGLAKGKKLYDKREDMVKKEQKRDIERLTKNKY